MSTTFLETYVAGRDAAGELAPGAAARLVNMFNGMAGHPPGAVARAVDRFLAEGHTRDSYLSGKPADATVTPLRRELARYGHRLRDGAIESIEAEIGPRAGQRPGDVAEFLAGWLNDPRQRGYLSDPRPATKGHEAVRSACYAVWSQLRPEAPDRIASELWLEADRQRISDDSASLERMVARRLSRPDAGKYTLSGEPLPPPEPEPAPPSRPTDRGAPPTALARDTTAPPAPERGEASAAPRRTFASQF
jgi:hypothetical protein